MEDYVLNILKSNKYPMNPLVLCSLIQRDKNQPFNKSTFHHDLMEVLLDLEDVKKITWNEEGLLCLV